MSITHENTLARRQALQVMFQNEFVGSSLQDLDTTDPDILVVSRCPEGVEDADLVGERLTKYAKSLLDGIIGHLDQIDEWIADTAQNWTIDRMPIVDRNIIRLATYEVAFCEDIPTGVAINEAVEIAKAFGGDESPKFVNGVLGRIASKLDADAELQQPCDEKAEPVEPQVDEPQPMEE